MLGFLGLNDSLSGVLLGAALTGFFGLAASVTQFILDRLQNTADLKRRRQDDALQLGRQYRESRIIPVRQAIEVLAEWNVLLETQRDVQNLRELPHLAAKSEEVSSALDEVIQGVGARITTDGLMRAMEATSRGFAHAPTKEIADGFKDLFAATGPLGGTGGNLFAFPAALEQLHTSIRLYVDDGVGTPVETVSILKR